MEKKPKVADGWKAVGVNLPPTVVDIIRAAKGDDTTGAYGMPYAMAAIIGALPWIAVQLHKTLPADEYNKFVESVSANIVMAMDIIIADDPPAAFEEMFARAKRAIQ